MRNLVVKGLGLGHICVYAHGADVCALHMPRDAHCAAMHDVLARSMVET